MAAKSKSRPKRRYTRSKPYVKPDNVGKPQHQPTPDGRALVAMAAALGVKHDVIARYLRIAPKTIRLHYREEIDNGKFRIDMLASRTFINQVTGGGLEKEGRGGDWTKAVPAMTKFYMATRLGLKETVINEHSGVDGAAIKIESLTDAQLDTLLTRLERGRKG